MRNTIQALREFNAAAWDMLPLVAMLSTLATLPLLAALLLFSYLGWGG